ncbi:uncharacterized protein Dwil_GK27011 [Drosophila willistoni]|uniref:RING-type domain-containing protein n=1 Tax=Drosophila willistoni TaxID=7260 RepID=A0A0Q9WSW8_DROWI|nr:E3 ubiquitin-protein ligase complex slx8-rfp subunit slx8-like [Drosophila willistoni]KRF99343.1 uncharacterized protein Dwil_GK27011 [Drosophila willistoni]
MGNMSSTNNESDSTSGSVSDSEDIVETSTNSNANEQELDNTPSTSNKKPRTPKRSVISQIAKKRALLKKSHNRASYYKCPICQDNAAENHPFSTNCGHVFCRVCIKRCIFMFHKCPLCRKSLTFKKIRPIYI